jgi:hypothetical protein
MWSIDQRPAELDLSQSRSSQGDCQVDQSPSATLHFQDAFVQSYPDVRAQHKGPAQEISSTTGSLPHLALDMDPAPSSIKEPPTNITISDRDVQYIQPDIVLKATPVVAPESNLGLGGQGKIDAEGPGNATSQMESINAKDDNAPLPNALDDCTAIEPEQGITGDIGPEVSGPMELQPDDALSSEGPEPNEKAQGDDVKASDSLASPAPSNSLESIDGDDDEGDDDGYEDKALKYLEKLKDKGILEKLVKKVTIPTNKKTTSAGILNADNHHCPNCPKAFGRRCELKYVGWASSPLAIANVFC